MPRLLSRQKLIPNGFVFLQPQSGWKAPKNISFNRLVDMLVAHRKGNTYLVKKYGLSTDPKVVADEVDEYNALFCQKMGWLEYIDLAAGGQPSLSPFPLLNQGRSLPHGQGQFAKVAAGGGVIIDWVRSKEDAVPAELSEKRAAICAKCPLNEKGDWTRFFTVPVSNGIRFALQKARGWNLTTSHDEELIVCSACDCPLPLKVHMPIQRIISKIPDDSKEALHPDCWIRKEGGL